MSYELIVFFIVIISLGFFKLKLSETRCQQQVVKEHEYDKNF